jgi:hypothetical protein
LSLDWFGPSGQLTPVVDGEFSLLQTILGLVGGELDFLVQIPALGINESGLNSFYDVNTVGAGPLAFRNIDDGGLGSLTRTGSLVELAFPIATSATLDGITIETSGTIYAQLLVPEPSALTMAALGVLGVTLVMRRRIRGRGSVAARSCHCGRGHVTRRGGRASPQL